MNDYLQRAQELYRRSHKEMEKALATFDIVMIREVAGKAWLAIVEALNGFLFSNGVAQDKLPKSDFDRMKALKKMVKNIDVIRMYRYVRSEFHINIYYEREFDKDLMEDHFNQLNKWIAFCANGNI